MRRAALVCLVACRAEPPSPPPPLPPLLVPPTAPPPSRAPEETAAPLPDVATDWCIGGLRGLDDETCYVLPPLAAGKPRRLLLYVHGIIPPVAKSVQKENVELAVLHAATRAGAAALVPRGRRGIGPVGAKDWWAWPTSPAAHAEHARAIVESWSRSRKKLEEVSGGAPFEKIYVAGSSNGAYFLTALALSGDLERLGFAVDGFGAMSGGARTTIAAKNARPFYVGFGTYDEETKKGARGLVAALDAAHWPVKSAEHPFGHGAKEVYLDEAFAFWDSGPPP